MNAKNHDSNVVKLETHQPKPIRFGSVCSGIEAASVAWHPIGWESAWFSEIEPFPSAVLTHHFPDVPNLGDMTKIRDRIASGEVYAPDVLVGGTPCFTAGHQVLTEQGYLPIEQITPGMRVVTHMGRLQRVVRIGSKQAKVGSLSAVGMPMGITCTPEHPFRSVMWESRNTRRNGEYTRIESFGEPDWTKAKDMQGKQWCALTSVDIEQPKICSTKFSDEAAMYIAGMYLSDGHVRGWRGKSKKTVVLSLNEDKFNKLLKFTPDQNITATREKNVVKVHICDTVFANWLLDNFGKGSEAKKIPAWCLSNEHKHLLLRGYIDTDGCKKESHCTINTVSKALAFGVGDLANTCGYVSSVAMIKTSDTTVIEGRTVNQRDYYQVRLFDKNLSRKSREYKGMLLRTVSKYEQLDTQEVFNIEVDEDHSYILNGAIVHNCQAFSVAGARKSLDDDRGQLTLEYVRLANEIDATRLVRGEQPVITVWENVPGVLSTKDNAFGCFLGALSGEDCELQPSGKKWTNAGCVFGPQRTVAWRVLDAQYFGVAQRRRRVFVVASARKGFNPTEVLFEFDGVRRDIAPSRSSGKEVARSARGGSKISGSTVSGKQLFPTLASSMGKKLWLGNQEAFSGDYFIASPQYENGGEVCDTVTRKLAKGSGGPSGNETGNLAIHPQVVHGTQDPIIQPVDNNPKLYDAYQHHGWREGETCGTLTVGQNNTIRGDTPLVIHATQDNQAFPLGCNHGQENAVICLNPDQPQVWRIYEAQGLAPTLQSGEGRGNAIFETYGIPGNWIGRKPENGGNATEPMDNIAPCQTKTDRHAVAYAFDSLSSNSMKSPNPNSGCREVDLAKTLDTTDPNPSKNQGGIGILQSQAFGIQGSMIGRSDTAGPQGSGVSDDISFTLTKGDRHAVAYKSTTEPVHETFNNKGFKQSEYYASTQETNACTLLRLLREKVGEETFAKWGLGILNSLQSPQILRQALHGKELRPATFSRCWVVYCALSRTKANTPWLLWSLQEAECDRCSSQGWEPSEQLNRELGAYMSELSQPGAQAERFMYDLWQASEGIGVLRETLSAIQEVGRSESNKEKSTHKVGAVRRLTAVECEFLQGFPRNYTQIPYRKKPADQCPDGPRYAACGNSMAVPVMQWIGQRIQDHIDGKL